MGTFNTDPPKPNGDDSDNTLLYKIARDLSGGGAFAGLTDTQLRATPVPVTATVTSESTAEATAAAPSYAEGQDAPLSQDLEGNLRTRNDRMETLEGAVTETAPATDTASSGLNGRLQRIAQRLTSLIALFGSTLATALLTRDAGAGWTSVFGVAGVAFTSADATTAAAVTDAPTSGQKLVITDIMVSSDTAMFVIFHEESTAGTIFFKVWVAANGFVQITPRSKLKLPTADKKLMVDASVAGNISVSAIYHSEA